MILRATLLLLLFTVLTGCVTTGDVNPMRTDKGRDAARDAYIQLGIGYLQQGNTGRAKSPLKKALELDSSNADAHAALALVFQQEMESELADEHFRKALSARSDDTRILNNYGGFLYEQKRYPEAKVRFEQAAKDKLSADAMVVTVEYDRTTDVKKGEVFKTDPAAGSESTRTAKITLYVSEGKPLVLVPTFIFMDVDQAVAEAKDLGLVPDLKPQKLWSTKNKISDQDLTPGTYVEVGTTVQLRYN